MDVFVMLGAPARRKPPVRRETGPPRAVWWANPRYAVMLLGVPMLVAAYLLPESVYVGLYGSLKHVDLLFLVTGLMVYAAFIAGTFVVLVKDPRPQNEDVLLYGRTFVWPLLVLTVFGYAVWFAYAAVQNGLGVVTEALLDVVLAREIGDFYYAKVDLFSTLPGITTFTQFGILYVTVEALLWVRGASDRRLAVARLVVVFSLSLLRAILLSERLALVELAIPLAVVFLLGRPVASLAYRNLVWLAPVFAAAGTFGFFAVGEYFRSWNFYQSVYSGPYLRFAAERFLGYYATAVNNSAVVYYFEPTQPLRYTLESFLQFPIVGEALNNLYSRTLGQDYVDYTFLLTTYANPEFNNAALIGQLLNEYTLFLAPIAALVLGSVLGTLYVSFLRGRLVGLLLYPSLFVGVLEISRIYYWAAERYFPTLAFVILSILLFRTMKVPVATSALAVQTRSTAGWFGRR